MCSFWKISQVEGVIQQSISAKVARGVIKDSTSRNHEHCQAIHGQRQDKGFHKKPSVKKIWGVAHSEQKRANNNDKVANRALI